MSDIAKCTHDACPRKEQCYRYTAPANELWQAYAHFRPGKDGTCIGFRPNGREDKSVALAAEVERLRQALRVIRTWAFMDDKPETKGSLVPSHVIELCNKELGREETR